jgi:hypothetical protein
VSDDARHEAAASGQEARRAAEVSKQVAEARAQEGASLLGDPELQEEWIRQDHLTYAGLLAIGIVMVQPFLTAASLDRSATVCVVSWSVAIPLLAALFMVNRQETFRRRRTRSLWVAVGRALALLTASVGLVAGFWHIHWIAGVVVMASTVVATGVHSAGFSRLELGEATAGREPGADDEPTGANGG